MYNDIKLEKGLYNLSGKSFTAALEELDPSSAYSGTPLEKLDAVIDKLEDFGVEDVYSAFDAAPLGDKGHGIFTVVSVAEFETSSPIYSLSYIYLPFKTELEIKVTGSKDISMTELYDYFDENIQPAIDDMTDLNCSLKKLSVRYDSNIQRLVLTIRIAANGLNKIERSTP